MLSNDEGGKGGGEEGGNHLLGFDNLCLPGPVHSICMMGQK